MKGTLKRKLTTILSADVAGYSRLMDEDEVSTIPDIPKGKGRVTSTSLS